MMHGCDFKINAVVVAQWISRQLQNYSLWFKSQHKIYAFSIYIVENNTKFVIQLRKEPKQFKYLNNLFTNYSTSPQGK